MNKLEIDDYGADQKAQKSGKFDVPELLSEFNSAAGEHTHDKSLSIDADGNMSFSPIIDASATNTSGNANLTAEEHKYNKTLRSEEQKHPHARRALVADADSLERTITKYDKAPGEEAFSDKLLKNDEKIAKTLERKPSAEHKLTAAMHAQKHELAKRYSDKTPPPKQGPTPGPTPEPGPEPSPLPSSSLPQAEETLTYEIDHNYSGQEQTQMLANLQAFESRCATQGSPAATYDDYWNGTVPDAGESKISQSAEMSTLDNISNLIENEGTAVVGSTNANEVAYQELGLAANPASTDQGDHNSCNVTTTEKTLFFDNPDEVTSVITSQALAGTSSIDGTTVTVPDSDLTPDQESGSYFSVNGTGSYSAVRSFASQLFQDAALTDVGEKDGFGPLNQGYSAQDATWGNGQTFGGLTPNDIGWIDSQLGAGTEGGAQVLQNTQDGNGGFTGTTTFSSEADLLSQLQSLQSSNNFPATLVLSGAYLEGQAYDGPTHVVTIDGLQQNASGQWQVYLNNQWGPGYNGWQSLDYVYNGTLPAQSTTDGESADEARFKNQKSGKQYLTK